VGIKTCYVIKRCVG